MFRRHAVGLASLVAGTLIVAGAVIGTAARAGNISDSITAQQEKEKEKHLTQGEKEAKKLLLLMDKDQNGKVSKQEFMSFMDAEFDRLDKDRSGELDVQELTQTPIHSSGSVHR